MKFAVVTLGSAGDLHPFLAVARALAERGHDVHLLSQAPHEVAAHAEGVAFRAIATDEDHARTLHHPRLWHPLHGFGVLWRHLAVPAIGPTIAALDELAGGPDAAPLVVFASPLALGARLAAERWPARVRLVTGYTAPMALRSTADPMFLGGWEVPGWLPQPVRRALWAGLDHWKLEPMARPAVAQWRQRLGLPVWQESVFADLVHATAGGLALYPAWFAPVPAAWRARGVHQLDFPLFEPTGTEPPAAALADFLSDPSPYVVAYPGSADRRAQAFADRVVDASRRLGRRTLVLSRFARAPSAEDASLTNLWVDEARLPEVLPHATAFVHHGGIGSIAQGLSACTPQLVLASAYDQFENGARLSRLRAGRWRPEAHALAADIEDDMVQIDDLCAEDAPLATPPVSRAGTPNAAASRAADLLEHMRSQLTLPGPEPLDTHYEAEHVRSSGRSLSSYALFFALLPTERQAARLALRAQQLIQEHEVTGTLTAPHRLHVTLQHLADYPPGPGVPRAHVDAAIAAGNQVPREAIELMFTSVRTVPGGNQAFVLQGDEHAVQAVSSLGIPLAQALRSRGLAAPRPATAHLTLVYGSRRTIAPQPIEPLGWRATRLVLILSHRGLGHHQHVQEWTLI